MTKHPFIAIIDFGSQYTHLITRNLKELGVDFKLLPPTAPTAKFEKAAGIILSGGPRSVLKIQRSLTHIYLKLINQFLEFAMVYNF